MKRPERIAAAAFRVAIVAALALFVAYVQGSGPQTEVSCWPWRWAAWASDYWCGPHA